MLEDSGESRCNSKTNSSFGKNEDDAEENASSKFKDGGSSGDGDGDGTLEESGEKKPYVRPYVRSKMARLRWTPDLHLRFVHAVERLGGQDRATPKLVLQMMNIKGLSIAHVKSHLQMYRSKKMDDQSQGIGHHDKLFMEGGDPNIFNLIKFPMFPTYHQRLNSTFRYDDASWNCHGNWIPRNTMGHRIPSFIRERSTLQTNEIKDVMGSSRGNPSGELTRLFHIGEKPQSRAFDGNGITSPLDLERAIITPLKRKASECNLDLNLYLGVKPRNEESTNHDIENDNDNGSSLSLSLSSPLSSLRVTRFIDDVNINATTGWFTPWAVRVGYQSRLTPVSGRDNNIDATTGFTPGAGRFGCQSRLTPVLGSDNNIDATTGFTPGAVRVGCQSRLTPVSGRDNNIDDATTGFTPWAVRVGCQAHLTPVLGRDNNTDDATTGFTPREVRAECQSRLTSVLGHDNNTDDTTENAKREASTLDLTL